MSNVEFTDIATLRQRARQHVEEGAVTEGYSADREEILKLLWLKASKPRLLLLSF